MTVELCPTIDELGAEWLTGALRAAGEIDDETTVASLSSCPVGTGQVADTHRLTPTYERADGGAGGGPETVIVKLASEDPASRTTGQMLRIYEVEVRFYQEVSPEIGMRHPGCLAATVDPATGFFTLLLTDAAPAEQGNDLDGCELEVAEACVRELALLHAPCWGRDDLSGRDWLDKSSPQHTTFIGMYLASAWPGFVERYGDRLPDEDLAVGKAAVEAFAGAAAHPGPRTVTHGDYRLDNMLLLPDDPRPCVVDWQTATWGPAALDVAYFLGCSLTVDDRRTHFDDLVEVYREALAAEGVDYPRDALGNDVARSALATLYQAVGASMSVGRTDRGDDMFMAMYQRSAALARDLGTLDAIGGAA